MACPFSKSHSRILPSNELDRMKRPVRGSEVKGGVCVCVCVPCINGWLSAHIT